MILIVNTLLNRIMIIYTDGSCVARNVLKNALNTKKVKRVKNALHNVKNVLQLVQNAVKFRLI